MGRRPHWKRQRDRECARALQHPGLFTAEGQNLRGLQKRAACTISFRQHSEVSSPFPYVNACQELWLVLWPAKWLHAWVLEGRGSSPYPSAGQLAALVLQVACGKVCTAHGDQVSDPFSFPYFSWSRVSPISPQVSGPLYSLRAPSPAEWVTDTERLPCDCRRDPATICTEEVVT